MTAQSGPVVLNQSKLAFAPPYEGSTIFVTRTSDVCDVCVYVYVGRGLFSSQGTGLFITMIQAVGGGQQADPLSLCFHVVSPFTLVYFLLITIVY